MASFENGHLVVDSGISARIGDSIAVDGVCLTVTENGDGRLAFDVVQETLDRAKAFGDEVNLEAALRAGDPLGGHYVQGHVDGVGTIRSTASSDTVALYEYKNASGWYLYSKRSNAECTYSPCQSDSVPAGFKYQGVFGYVYN